MASGAGLNRVGQRGGKTLLQLVPAATAVASPLAGYGTIGVNDSGVVMHEAIAFTKWTFQLAQNQTATPLTGYTVTLYGTIDPAAYDLADGSTAVNAANWFQLPAPSEQGSTGNVVNPLYATGQVLNSSLALVAVRAVITAVSTPAGTGMVLGFAAP